MPRSKLYKTLALARVIRCRLWFSADEHFSFNIKYIHRQCSEFHEQNNTNRVRFAELSYVNLHYYLLCYIPAFLLVKSLQIITRISAQTK